MPGITYTKSCRKMSRSLSSSPLTLPFTADTPVAESGSPARRGGFRKPPGVGHATSRKARSGPRETGGKPSRGGSPPGRRNPTGRRKLKRSAAVPVGRGVILGDRGDEVSFGRSHPCLGREDFPRRGATIDDRTLPHRLPNIVSPNTGVSCASVERHCGFGLEGGVSGGSRSGDRDQYARGVLQGSAGC